jgi:hypothetical protein
MVENAPKSALWPGASGLKQKSLPAGAVHDESGQARGACEALAGGEGEAAAPEGEQTYDGVAYGGEVPYTTERAKGRLARAPKKTHMPEAPGMSFEREAPVRRWLTE